MSGFDRVAPYYDRLKHLIYGYRLETLESSVLDMIDTDAANILIVGGGTGSMLPLVLNKFSGEIDYVESSQRMISRAMRWSDSPRVHFHHSLLQEFRLKSYDVIITSFFLDVLAEHELEVQVRRLSEALSPFGRWLYADFAYPVDLSHKILLTAMLSFFRISAGLQASDLYDHSSQIMRTGLSVIDQTDAMNGFLAGKIFGK